ncbi:NADH-quinone oxidoreductase subunit NuoF [Treponema pedis]|uniref:NADH-quinone oxidoreductase subunit NuoF n=2 Tax=Treponema pedis TaxID=409322 RepID=UPI0003FBB562|nr:NADH-quinone oxidoreductase subunit NuoF [Treponema pedis]
MSYSHYILVCGGSACESSRSVQIYENLITEAKNAGISDEVKIIKTGCFGFCEKGPIVKILPEDTFYVEVKPEDAFDIINTHIVRGMEVTRLLYDKTKKSSEEITEIPFYKKQLRIALRNCGLIDPENIEDYIAHDGYFALEKALFEMTGEQIVDEIKKSGLRGRGGAGFPTGLKWEAGLKAQGDVKYVVCNADEGDPGAYMDRSTIEGDPHSIIEAMAICGKAIGANKGFVYIRAEYPLAVFRLEKALKQAAEYGLLGKDILGSGFDFEIEIRLGAGAFVCGEETALLRSIEGKRGMPTPKPPFPAQAGLWGKPTIINNVETWANIPVILNKGAAWFRAIGTEDSAGTKVFALTGKVENSGLVEVPMGTTLREIIFEIGGGIKNGKKFKAVQTGGPSGGIITPDALDTPIDFKNLQALGSMMGSGGMIVMDEDDCVVDVAKFYMEFCVDESCGKCSPCRIGTRQIHAILDKISKGKGELSDLDKLEEIGFAMQKASLCALGQSAPNPTLSTIQKFRDEYIAHITDKKCLTGKCKNLVSFYINEKCIGCGACARKCPANCITGERKSRHVINQIKCLKCAECFNTCRFAAIDKK